MNTDWSGVLLDLLNTTPVVDGVGTDVLDARWLSARGVDADLVGVRQLRDDMQRVVRGDVDAEVLGDYVRAVVRTPRIVDGAVAWTLNANWAARVVLEWGELQVRRPGRLRACANGECHLFLLDRSRGGTGRWCSMSGCGNRMKARRHYGRTVGKPAD